MTTSKASKKSFPPQSSLAISMMRIDGEQPCLAIRASRSKPQVFLDIDGNETPVRSAIWSREVKIDVSVFESKHLGRLNYDQLVRLGQLLAETTLGFMQSVEPVEESVEGAERP